MRIAPVLALALLVAAPAAAQHQHADAAHAAHGGQLPEGWQARTDRGQPLDGVHFMEMDGRYHVTTGPAVVLYRPDATEAGDYDVSARFTQNRAPEHPESYGIVFGGRELEGDAQTYSYFLVRGTGEYFVATRRGAERIKNIDWTPHPAVAKQDAATGRAANVLGVRAAGDEVVLLVNEQEVARLPRAELETDGLLGIRVNHNLDVVVDQVRR